MGSSPRRQEAGETEPRGAERPRAHLSASRLGDTARPTRVVTCEASLRPVGALTASWSTRLAANTKRQGTRSRGASQVGAVVQGSTHPAFMVPGCAMASNRAPNRAQVPSPRADRAVGSLHGQCLGRRTVWGSGHCLRGTPSKPPDSPSGPQVEANCGPQAKGQAGRSGPLARTGRPSETSCLERGRVSRRGKGATASAVLCWPLF